MLSQEKLFYWRRGSHIFLKCFGYIKRFIRNWTDGNLYRVTVFRNRIFTSWSKINKPPIKQRESQCASSKLRKTVTNQITNKKMAFFSMLKKGLTLNLLSVSRLVVPDFYTPDLSHIHWLDVTSRNLEHICIFNNYNYIYILTLRE